MTTGNSDFVELTSFGTLFAFAAALEEAIASAAKRAAALDGCADHADALAACTRLHDKRAKELARLRRERLNEVVLQRIEGMTHTDYIPALAEDTSDGAQALAALATAEETAARFYEDAGRAAKNVLTGLERTFSKYARKNRDQATALRPR